MQQSQIHKPFICWSVSPMCLSLAHFLLKVETMNIIQKWNLFSIHELDEMSLRNFQCIRGGFVRDRDAHTTY